MSVLQLRDIRKSYGNIEVIHGVDLGIERGEFVVFVGPSGCGKSTLLRMIAGLEEIDGGTLEIGDQVMNNVPPSKRGIAMVFQSYALYPHMTVYQNMAFGMKIAKRSKGFIDERVRKAAEILRLTDYLDRLPKALSGGQRQRVAIGRAICRDPQVFLFDEPLSNLDAALRVATRIEISKLSEALPDTTMIYVTHDQVEAMTLADRIVVLSSGRIEQVGSPLELYERPANQFVAQFIGSPAMNIISGMIEETGSNTIVSLRGGSTVAVNITTESADVGAPVNFGVRPEHLYPSDDGFIEGTISLIESLGEVTNLYVERTVGVETVVAKLSGTSHHRRGDKVRLGAKEENIHLFREGGSAFARSAPLSNELRDGEQFATPKKKQASNV